MITKENLLVIVTNYGIEALNGAIVMEFDKIIEALNVRAETYASISLVNLRENINTYTYIVGLQQRSYCSGLLEAIDTILKAVDDFNHSI